MRTGIWMGLVLVLFLGAAPFDADGAEWEDVTLKPKVHKALIDCRSLTARHETRVELATDWNAAEHTFQFLARPDGSYQVDITGADGKTKKKSLGDEPGLIPINAFGVKYALTWRPAHEGDAVWVASAYGVEFKVPGGVAYFVDSDRDGKIEGVTDGYVAPESRTVAPLTGEIWTRETAVLYRYNPNKKGWEKSDYPMPLPDNADHTEAWRLLQWRRQQCGVLTVRYKPALEKPMAQHIVYCRKNKYKGHEQEEGKPGYTPEGAAAGKQSILGFNVTSRVAGMEEQLSTLYHRNALLNPGLTHTAFVVYQGMFAANVRDSADGKFGKGILLYPPHGMQNVPCRFAKNGETPMPSANQQTQLHNYGTAIGVFSALLEDAESLPERPRLKVTELEGKKRKPGKTFRRNIKYPGKSPHQDVPTSNFGNVALLPAEPLMNKTTYLCEIEMILPEGSRVTTPKGPPFVYQWEFTTEK